MPFALAIIGIVLVVAGVRNKQDQLFSLVKGDFTGPNNYIFWMLSIFAIGAIGYIPRLKPISTGFLALIIVVLFLKKGQGFFAQLGQAVSTTTTVQPSAQTATQPLPNLQGLQPLGGIQ